MPMSIHPSSATSTPLDGQWDGYPSAPLPWLLVFTHCRAKQTKQGKRLLVMFLGFAIAGADQSFASIAEKVMFLTKKRVQY